MTYAFTHMGNFLLLLLLLRTPFPQPSGPYLSLEPHIPASKPKSQSWGPNPLRQEFWPWSRDLGLKSGIWASRLGLGLIYGPGGWGEGGYEGEGGERGEEGGANYVWKDRSSPLPKKERERKKKKENDKKGRKNGRTKKFDIQTDRQKDTQTHRREIAWFITHTQKKAKDGPDALRDRCADRQMDKASDTNARAHLTCPSRPIRFVVWIVERMCNWPTDRLTN